MKKSLLALAALCAFAGAASAQSSVTLFGVVDVNARQVKNGDTKQTQLGTDGLSSSRLGFRGVEDLGGGLKAGFWLESQVQADGGTANATRFWHRRATVSLMGSFGEVRLGRQLDPSYNAWGAYDTFNTNGLADLGSLVSVLGSGADTKSRIDNGVNYILPSNLGGFYGEVAAAPGEGTAGKKYIGTRLGYAAGPVDVSLGYGQTDASLSTDDKLKVLSLAASYDLKVVKLFGAVVQSKYLSQKQRVSHVGVIVPVSTAGKFRVSFANSNLSGTSTTGASVDANDANQFALGYIHSLSKRTELYTTYAQIKNKGSSALSVATVNGYTIKAGDKSRGLEFGVKHSF
ncbi:putative porin [Sphaerotilus hippei]|uniref:Putative porin n=1 Tax=Sphaerotilus hippei TaxID=744406 RepID=A0A318HA01_9BURK|nr:porin [Sphaerotilus hippei]PXW97117.1 putative porin [Sphaerotilus hippei]